MGLCVCLTGCVLECASDSNFGQGFIYARGLNVMISSMYRYGHRSKFLLFNRLPEHRKHDIRV